MPPRAERRARLKLPTRIRSAVESSQGFAPRLSLADRIAGLQGVNVTEGDCDAGLYAVRVVLTAPMDAKLAPEKLTLFAEISRDGIVLHGLSGWDKHQVLSSGWGKLRKRHVVLYLPRDERELEVCWTILQRAYDCLLDLSTDPSRYNTYIADLPHFVRPSI